MFPRDDNPIWIVASVIWYIAAVFTIYGLYKFVTGLF